MSKVLVVLSTILLTMGVGLQWFVELCRNTGMNILLSSAPNAISAALFGTVLALWFGKGEFRTSASFSLGLVLYEFLQLILPERTFDIMDLVATATGLMLSTGILFFYKKNSETRQCNTAS